MKLYRYLFPRWTSAAVILTAALLVGAAFIISQPTLVQAGAPRVIAFPRGDGGDCLSCHSAPGMAVTLNDNETLSVTIDPDAYETSVHANLPCTTCHAGMDTIPHEMVTVPDGQRYASLYKDTCQQCHANEFTQYSDSVHAQVTGANASNTPVCSDCHNPHTQTKIQVTDRVNIPQTCAKCHSTIFADYKNSVHGAGVLDKNNPDVPTCTDCHGVHTISDPTTNTSRLSSVQMCGNCHTNATIMDKYGLSTDVMNTYVADFHGTTITLFEVTDPEAATNKPVCYDCHGVHNISKVDDPQTGLMVKENLLITCKKCHPDANANFPDSWLSHYTPSPDKWPLVYYVNLFYQILIPVVIGGMLIYVITDFVRGRLDKRKKNEPKTETPAPSEPPTEPTVKPVETSLQVETPQESPEDTYPTPEAAEPPVEPENEGKEE